MVELKINKGNVEKLMATGPMDDLLSELCLALEVVYSSIDNQNHEAGKAFKNSFKKYVNERAFSENVLNAEENKNENEDRDDKMEKVLEALNTIMDFVGDVDDDIQHFKA